MRIAIAIAAALLLAGCGTTQGIAVPPPPPNLVQPDSRLTEDCPRPGVLPDRPLTQREAETLWRGDRGALVACGKRHAALRDFYADRDSALRGR